MIGPRLQYQVALGLVGIATATVAAVGIGGLLPAQLANCIGYVAGLAFAMQNDFVGKQFETDVERVRNSLRGDVTSRLTLAAFGCLILGLIACQLPVVGVGAAAGIIVSMITFTILARDLL